MVRLTDRPDMTLDVYRGRKTTMQQLLHNASLYYYGRRVLLHNASLYYHGRRVLLHNASLYYHGIPFSENCRFLMNSDEEISWSLISKIEAALVVLS